MEGTAEGVLDNRVRRGLGLRRTAADVHGPQRSTEYRRRREAMQGARRRQGVSQQTNFQHSVALPGLRLRMIVPDTNSEYRTDHSTPLSAAAAAATFRDGKAAVRAYLTPGAAQSDGYTVPAAVAESTPYLGYLAAKAPADLQEPRPPTPTDSEAAMFADFTAHLAKAGLIDAPPAVQQRSLAEFIVARRAQPTSTGRNPPSPPRAGVPEGTPEPGQVRPPRPVGSAASRRSTSRPVSATTRPSSATVRPASAKLLRHRERQVFLTELIERRDTAAAKAWQRSADAAPRVSTPVEQPCAPESEPVPEARGADAAQDGLPTSAPVPAPEGGTEPQDAPRATPDSDPAVRLPPATFGAASRPTSSRAPRVVPSSPRLAAPSLADVARTKADQVVARLAAAHTTLEEHGRQHAAERCLGPLRAQARSKSRTKTLYLRAGVPRSPRGAH